MEFLVGIYGVIQGFFPIRQENKIHSLARVPTRQCSIGAGEAYLAEYVRARVGKSLIDNRMQVDLSQCIKPETSILDDQQRLSGFQMNAKCLNERSEFPHIATVSLGGSVCIQSLSVRKSESLSSIIFSLKRVPNVTE
jgi:hypothetical protein